MLVGELLAHISHCQTCWARTAFRQPSRHCSRGAVDLPYSFGGTSGKREKKRCPLQHSLIQSAENLSVVTVSPFISCRILPSPDLPAIHLHSPLLCSVQPRTSGTFLLLMHWLDVLLLLCRILCRVALAALICIP